MGAPLLVASGVLAFAFQWRAVVAAFPGLRRRARTCSVPAGVEVPMSWFALGAGLSGAGVVLLTWRWFDVPVVYGLLALLLTFALALVVCRVTGETDITPTAAMGKIMQLTYGGLMPQNAPANLMTAGITVGASSASADLMTDLKSGYLLGANPRRQFVAQLLGVLPGTLATVFCFSVLIPDATAFTDAPGHPAAFAVPGAQPWMAVARLFKEGIANLHPMARQGLACGLAVGALLAVLERMFPGRKKYLPSATGLGLGLFLSASLSLTILLGATVAWIVTRCRTSATDLVVPVASGLIVGEALVGTGRRGGCGGEHLRPPVSRHRGHIRYRNEPRWCLRPRYRGDRRTSILHDHTMEAPACLAWPTRSVPRPVSDVVVRGPSARGPQARRSHR